jgi:hypothetical protein
MTHAVSTNLAPRTMTGTFANRPSSANDGDTYRATDKTDADRNSRWVGSQSGGSWTQEVATTQSLTVSALTDSGLTAGRITLASPAGLLADDAGLTYDTAGDALAVTGTGTFTGDIAAAGGFRQSIGTFEVVLAASQTGTRTKLGGTINGGWVAPRAGSVTAFTAMLSAAVTGGGFSATLKVFKNGSLLNAALNLAFTQAGAETTKSVTAAKDTYTFAAGDILDVRYDSTAITNTPDCWAAIEVEN